MRKFIFIIAIGGLLLTACSNSASNTTFKASQLKLAKTKQPAASWKNEGPIDKQAAALGMDVISQLYQAAVEVLNEKRGYYHLKTVAANSRAIINIGLEQIESRPPSLKKRQAISSLVQLDILISQIEQAALDKNRDRIKSGVKKVQQAIKGFKSKTKFWLAD